MAARHKIAVFASGDGSNFEAIAEACLRGEIDAEVALMICDKPSARVCSRAERLGISSFVFTPADYASKTDYEHEIAARCEQAGIELICLAGYMRIVGKNAARRFRGPHRQSASFAAARIQGREGDRAGFGIRRQGIRRNDTLCRRIARRRAHHRATRRGLPRRRHRGDYGRDTCCRTRALY